MRVRSVLSEALRDVASGTAAAALLATVLAVAVGGLAVADVRAVVDVSRTADRYRSAGAAVSTVESATLDVDGARCEALGATAGVVAAGAARPAEPTQAVALPGSDLTTWEVTPGLLDVVAASGGRPSGARAAGGVWLSADLAATLGVEPGGTVATRAGTAHVAGVYTWPDDGRRRDLGYAVLVPVAGVGRFDRCWAQVWPPDEGLSGLLRAVVEPTGADEARTGTLNTTLGEELDAVGMLARRPTRPAPAAALAVGAALGLVAVRRRRLELASALHAGVPRPHLVWQHLVEAAAWALAGSLVAAAAVAVAAATGNPDPVLAACGAGWRAVMAGAVGVVLGTLVGVLATRESHLFRYAKDR
jgi:hypothetical protein